MILTMWVSIVIALLGGAIAWVVRRLGRHRWPRASGVAALSVTILTAPAFAFALQLAVFALEGQPPMTVRVVADGVTYRRLVLRQPNLAVVHVVEIDRPATRRFGVTPPVLETEGLRNLAGYGPAAMESLQADIVINGNFFRPFYDNYVFDAYPGPGDVIEPIGPVVCEGKRYGMSKPDWPSFYQSRDGKVGFGSPLTDAVSAVTGRQFLLKAGVVTVANDEPPYPRTAMAMDASRSTLWLVVVDGKQPGYSVGLSLTELAKCLRQLGADDAIELDGGGSSVMLVRGWEGPELLNRTCHTKIPGRQRPTGVFLGVKLCDRPS